MKKQKDSKQKNLKSGFTLLELLVVVLIIGILAAIALPQYQKVIYKTKYSTVMPIVKAVGDAMERYYIIHDSYPYRINDIDISLESDTIEDYHGVDMVSFNWGDCYFEKGDNALFACNLTKELVAFGYSPEAKIYYCASDRNTASRSYKFCANMPNSELIGDGLCIWKGTDRVACSVFKI